jgi:alpha-tubulin suppressor-like RCC1 family protein
MFVGSDEQIMGLGYRACGRDEGAEKLKILERPPECTGYKKVCAGKFFRLILTNEGRLFFCGQNKKYMVGKDIEVNQWCDKFYEVQNLFPLSSNEKIIDVDGGKHFMIIVTDAGKVYTSGYMMYRTVSEIRHNSEENEDYPCELRLNTPETEGWKAV